MFQEQWKDIKVQGRTSCLLASSAFFSPGKKGAEELLVPARTEHTCVGAQKVWISWDMAVGPKWVPKMEPW